jgi:hypothetical protein
LSESSANSSTSSSLSVVSSSISEREAGIETG